MEESIITLDSIMVLLSISVAISYLIERPSFFTMLVGFLTGMGDLVFLIGKL